MTDDIGLEALVQLRDVLCLEVEWTVEEPRGFSWWGCERRLRVWAEAPVLDREGGGEDTCRLQAELELLGPGAVTQPLRGLAEELGEVFPLSAILVHPDGRLAARTAVELRSGSPELVDLFTQAVALQWACGRSVVEGLVKASGRAAARSHPPARDERKGPCRLERWLAAAAEAGGARGRWAEAAELEQALEVARGYRVPCGFPEPDGPAGHLWAAVPFPQGNEELDPVAPALVTVDAEATHPWLGQGARLQLLLPPFALRTVAGLDVLALNAQDARQDTSPHLLGGWRWVLGGPGGRQRAPALEVFLPNLLFRPGRLAEVVRALVGRGRALADDWAAPPSQQLDGAVAPSGRGETLIGRVRAVARAHEAGWEEALGELLEQAGESRHFLEALDAAWALQGAGLLPGALVYPHVDEEAPVFRWGPHLERHLPALGEQGLVGLVRYQQPALAEASTDLGILAWQRCAPGDRGLHAAQALEHFEQAAVRGCAYGAFNAGCLLVTVDGLKSLWRAVPMLRFAALNGVPGAGEALAWLDRWGRFSVRWL